MPQIDEFIQQQLNDWEDARLRYDALKKVKTKDARVGDTLYRVQFNPARIVSSAAKLDPKSLQERKCFLCDTNRPSEQHSLPFGSQYQILVNPFPIFPKHLTIPSLQHLPQRIGPRFSDMLALADYLPSFVIFYNGPRCGASAPDHAHFQAGNKGFLPIEEEWKSHRLQWANCGSAILWHLSFLACPALAIESSVPSDISKCFQIIYHSMEKKEGEEEPMMNILAWKEDDHWIVIVFPREQHRPACYFAEGERNLLISPASVDMGGVFITPLEKDFEKITASDIEQILRDVCFSDNHMNNLMSQIKRNI
jgi:ATP adenylyltransferase/5',5'''-P-1,P-4-tetraphosphate phosphorylase II